MGLKGSKLRPTTICRKKAMDQSLAHLKSMVKSPLISAGTKCHPYMHRIINPHVAHASNNSGYLLKNHDFLKIKDLWYFSFATWFLGLQTFCFLSSYSLNMKVRNLKKTKNKMKTEVLTSWLDFRKWSIKNTAICFKVCNKVRRASNTGFALWNPRYCGGGRKVFIAAARDS